MNASDETNVPVKAKALLIDPSSMRIEWMNESAAESVPATPPADVRLDQVVPEAAALGVAEAITEVAASGTPRHLRTSLVSTVRGGLDVVISLYRMPGDRVLLLMENAWQPKHGRPGDGADRPRRRGR